MTKIIVFEKMYRETNFSSLLLSGHQAQAQNIVRASGCTFKEQKPGIITALI